MAGILFKLTAHSGYSAMSSDTVLSQGRPAALSEQLGTTNYITYLEQRTKCVIPQRLWKARSKRFTSTVYEINSPAIRREMPHIPNVVAQPEVTPHDMLEQPHSLGFHQLIHHITQNRPNRIEPLICMADIRQSRLIKQDFLHDEYCHSL